MEAAFNLFLWGLAGTLALALPGALFGGAARVVAFLRHEAHEATLKQAILGGMLQGGLFVGSFGFLAGMLVGWQASSERDAVRILLLLACGTSALMVAALFAAGLAYFLTWLGDRFLGLFLSITISGGLLAIVAWRCGLPRQTAALGALAIMLLAAGFAAIGRWFAPSPPRPSAAEVAEALWHDWQPANGDDLRQKPASDDRFHP
ncbi:MAG: hypothetical protein JNM56_17020 [Planctomycetia bacterium]|nr:hypothetical protein [Planctomycetia bacterium]